MRLHFHPSATNQQCFCIKLPTIADPTCIFHMSATPSVCYLESIDLKSMTTVEAVDFNSMTSTPAQKILQYPRGSRVSSTNQFGHSRDAVCTLVLHGDVTDMSIALQCYMVTSPTRRSHSSAARWLHRDVDRAPMLHGRVNWLAPLTAG